MFNGPILESFRKDSKEALKGVEKKYGISLDLGKITYSNNSFEAKLKAIQVETGKTGAQMQFEQCCSIVGLKPEDYLKEFQYGGDKYRIIAIKPKSPKFPIIAENLSTGSSYKFPIDMAK